MNIAMFIISRVIIGAGSVVVAGVGAPYITEIAHPAQRSTATALFLTFYSVGSIIAGWCTLALSESTVLHLGASLQLSRAFPP